MAATVKQQKEVEKNRGNKQVKVTASVFQLCLKTKTNWYLNH